MLPDNSSLVAVPGSGTYPAASTTAPMIDVFNLDGTGQACSSLPAGSLTGDIALIFRGNCTFETKIDNAQAAGALAAVVYDNVSGEPLVLMGVGAAALPAVFIANADGLALKAKLTNGFAVTVQFTPGPHYTSPASIANFSSTGPNIDYSIKPDLLAVGENIYTAAQKLDSNGELYDASGYTLTQGTSFSAPLVAGAAAVIEQARPGLTPDQYRSLLINTADPASLVPGTAASVQQGGAGLLNVLSALNATVVAAPVSISFGVGGGTVNATSSLTLTNVGTVSDTFQISIAPASSSAPVPQLTATSVPLDQGASVTLPVQFQASSLTPGAYEGFINVQGVQSSVTTHVPYWYGVSSGQLGHITVIDAPIFDSAGSQDTVFFRVTDAIGIPIPNIQPSVTPVTTGARVSSLTSVDDAYPSVFAFSVRLASQPGINVYQIQEGSLSNTVTIVGQ
ncbi:Peptidase S8 and S53, subtilisin, kexin, sedolisin (fragment) [Candidatus Sulfopaludibacter sp. SbA3]